MNKIKKILLGLFIIINSFNFYNELENCLKTLNNENDFSNKDRCRDYLQDNINNRKNFIEKLDIFIEKLIENIIKLNFNDLRDFLKYGILIEQKNFNTMLIKIKMNIFLESLINTFEIQNSLNNILEKDIISFTIEEISKIIYIAVKRIDYKINEILNKKQEVDNNFFIIKNEIKEILENYKNRFIDFTNIKDKKLIGGLGFFLNEKELKIKFTTTEK